MNVPSRGRGPGRVLGGRALSNIDRPAYIRAEVEEIRRELQEKYNKEAKEAEEKRIRREQKKREEWLKRQELLVRPGFRLGTGTRAGTEPANLRRDMTEHEDTVSCDLQDHDTHDRETEEQFQMLLQQQFEREQDGAQLDNNIQLHLRALREKRLSQYSNSRRQPNFTNTRPSASNERGSRNPKDRAHFSGAAQRTSLLNSTSSDPRKPLVLRVPQNATVPNSGSAHPRKPSNFLGVAQSSSMPNSDPRKPSNFLGVAQSSSMPNSGSAESRNPSNFLGVAQSSSMPNSGSADPRKPSNFLGVAQSSSMPNSGSAESRNPSNFLGVAQSTSKPNSGSADPRTPPNFLGVAQNASFNTEGDTEIDHRERMRAARLRMQQKYDEQVKKSEEEKDQFGHTDRSHAGDFGDSDTK
ncbi:hypothetical protein L9F63_005690 [Diploptera punctata]|uniref:Uncharacterized protein n=1 Tax=Diploptera punctata TaxID=6984 RepID=A0AAD7ZCK2_DIPPU|nr:hypothetical protein L9F63_005690 [Diploptera punctata]